MNTDAPTMPPARPPERPDDERAADARYILSERLGEGAMGAVWAARDLALDRDVAFKVMHDELLGADHQQRLADEARAMARLNHPNVVAVYDVGQRNGRMFLTMELVRGCSLSKWLEAPRTLDQLLEIFRGAAAGLAAAHAAGIVHRDVKPTNILVGDDGRARVADFGVAHAATVRPGAGERVTAETAGMIGTPAYMSPEQLAGEPSDARADQFGLCVSLYEALHGKPPFEAATVGGLLMAMTRGVPPPVRDVPAWLTAVVARGLTANPDARFPSMTALGAALAGPRPRRALYAALAIGVVAAAGTIAFVALRGGNGATDEVRAPSPDAAVKVVATSPPTDAPPPPPDTESDNPKDAYLRLLSAGLQALDEGDAKAARDLLEKAIPLERGASSALVGAARASCDLGDAARARALLAKIPKDTPKGKQGRLAVILQCNERKIDLRETVAGEATGAAPAPVPKPPVATLPTDKKERMALYMELMNAARAARKAGDFATARKKALEAVPLRDINPLEPLSLAVMTSCQLSDVPRARELFSKIPLLISNARQYRADTVAFCERQGISLVDLMDPSERKTVVP